jgi:hypothetical protein
MRRRQFNRLLAGISLWPFAAHAQASREPPKVGFVYPGSVQPALVQARADELIE